MPITIIVLNNIKISVFSFLDTNLKESFKNIVLKNY